MTISSKSGEGFLLNLSGSVKSSSNMSYFCVVNAPKTSRLDQLNTSRTVVMKIALFPNFGLSRYYIILCNIAIMSYIFIIFVVLRTLLLNVVERSLRSLDQEELTGTF